MHILQGALLRVRVQRGPDRGVHEKPLRSSNRTLSDIDFINNNKNDMFWKN